MPAPAIIETAAGAAQLVKTAPTMQPSTYVLMAILLAMVGGFFTIARAVIRVTPAMRKLQNETDATLIETLAKRVDKLEADLREQRDYYERKLETLQAHYEAEQRVSRHALNNVKMRFRALVMLLKRLPDPPEMLRDILVDIEALEAEQALAEAAEKGSQTVERGAAQIGSVTA